MIRNCRPFSAILLLTLLFPSFSYSQLFVNELQSSNNTTIADFESTYPDWIELFNAGASSVDLTGYGLSDESGAPYKWVFPSISIGGGAHLLVFASSKDTILGAEYHTNFKLASSGEKVFLTAPNGVLISRANPDALLADQSWGRMSDASSDWSVFTSPTPGASNGGGLTSNKLEKPDNSLKSGFYANSQSVTLTCPDPGAAVLYSIDGNDPSLVYSGSVEVNSNLVVKSMCVKSGSEDSDVKTDSYFIDVAHDIPVMSLSFRPDDFYDIDSGIYVLGDDYEVAEPHYGANFWEDWEREVHLEYFVNEDEKIEQNVGAKIFGGWSRAHDMKSIRLIARKEYGEETMGYEFFDRKPHLDKFDQLVLRNSGNDFNGTMWSDALNHLSLSQLSGVDYMEYQPVAVYFNGVYKGLHNLRERVNPEYIAFNHDISVDNIDFLEFNGGLNPPDNSDTLTPNQIASQIKQGSNVAFQSMYDFITQNDMSNSTNYMQAEALLDIDLFVDYFAAEIYHINWDWPHNNIRFWRSPDLDGKWRYIYYDTEYGQGIYNQSNTRATFDELDRVINDERNVHSYMLKSLLTNVDFRRKFVNRSADFMNTIFKDVNYRALADQLEEVIFNEIISHLTLYDEWPGPCCRQDRINDLHDFMNDRPSMARGYVDDQFGVSQNTVTLNVFPTEAGVIKISTIFPDAYPWDGVYFNGVPVEVTAIANPGYAFQNWSGESSSPNNSVTLNLSGSTTSITANFTSESNFADLKITEINYNSLSTASESEDWFEIYNNGSASIDLSNWSFKDEHPAHSFVFPQGTVLNSGEYLVVARDLAAFADFYPSVSNVVGSFGFSLGNSGDVLRLFDSYNVKRLELKYNDKLPWPEIADGKGATLELVDTETDFTVPTNWQAKCKNGSPGTATQDCDCGLNVDLGEDVVACSGVSELLSSGLSPVDRDFFWYADGNLIAVTTDYLATLANNYTLIVGEGACLAGDELKIIDELKVDLGKDIELCDPRFIWLEADVSSSGMTYAWEKDGVLVGQESTLYVSVPGSYSINLSAAGCVSVSDEINVTSSGPIPSDDVFCEEDGFASINVSGEGDFEWYDMSSGGQFLDGGNSYDATSLIGDTTFYVEEVTFKQATGGKPTFETTSDHLPYDRGMLFTVHEKMTLKAVSAEANVVFYDLDLVVRVLDENDNIVAQVTAQLPDGEFTRVELNIELEPGNYLIDAFGTSGNFTQDQLRYDSGVSDYPYQVGDLITITGNNYGTESYYYFYNWEAEVDRRGCARVPVNLTSEDCTLTSTSDKVSDVLNVYPNPVFDELHFIGDIERVQLFNLSGMKVLETLADRLDVSGLASGVYIVEIISETGKYVERVEVLD